eukprot:symbB.v1.2.041331.t1/scaffold8057.1/size7944/1
MEDDSDHILENDVLNQAETLQSLHNEVDECLASLEEWREQRRKDSEALESQWAQEALQSKGPEEFGRSLSLEWEAIEAISFDDEVPEAPLDHVDHGTVPAPAADRPRAVAEHEAWGPMHPDPGNPLQAAGRQAHLAKLREEVEALKMKEAEWERRLQVGEPFEDLDELDQLEHDLIHARGDVDEVQHKCKKGKVFLWTPTLWED